MQGADGGGVRRRDGDLILDGFGGFEQSRDGAVAEPVSRSGGGLDEALGEP